MELLVKAIIIQAVLDYKKALIMREESEIEKLEKFFKESLYLSFYEIDADYLIKNIRKEVENEKHRRR